MQMNCSFDSVLNVIILADYDAFATYVGYVIFSK